MMLLVVSSDPSRVILRHVQRVNITYKSDIQGPPVDTSFVLFDLNGLSCAMWAQANTKPA